MRVLVFGASSAQGYWDSQGGWADRLKRYYDNLQMRDFSVDQPAVMNLGVSGDTSGQVLARINPESEARRNEKGLAFIIQVGGNNAAEQDGKTMSTAKEYQDEIKSIVDTARKFSDKIIVVGLQAVDEKKTTPVPWIDYYYKNKNLAMFEHSAQRLCADISVPLVPLFEEFKERIDAGREVLAHDGLHPSTAGHQLIFQLVRPELDKLLSDS